MTVVSSARVVPTRTDGLTVTLLERASTRELFLTARQLPGQTVPAMLLRAAQAVRRHEARITGLTILHGGAQMPAALAALREILGDIRWPITWVENASPAATAPAGVEIHAVAGTKVTPIVCEDRIVGTHWEDLAGRHCILGDLRDPNPAHTPAAQAQQVFADMVAALQSAGFSFRQVFRTWFRNRNIVRWYAAFNRVRTKFYNQINVFDGLLPASTGIGADNPFGAALVAGLRAWEPRADGVRAYAVDSPRQDSACHYGSSFSRAVEVDFADHRLLTVSGTASIDHAGRTAHAGDVERQIDLTMNVIEAILGARGFTFADATRALAYFRQAADLPLWEKYARAHDLADLPVVVSQQIVCRDDLLFELELDALRTA